MPGDLLTFLVQHNYIFGRIPPAVLKSLLFFFIIFLFVTDGPAAGPRWAHLILCRGFTFNIIFYIKEIFCPSLFARNMIKGYC